MKKKYFYTTVIVITFSIIITVLVMPLLLNQSSNKTLNDTSKMINFEQVEKTSQSTIILGEKRFVIKNYNGKIAVFEENSVNPLMVTEYKIEDLPEEAVIKINNGISVTGEEELYRTLEDFSE